MTSDLSLDALRRIGMKLVVSIIVLLTVTIWLESVLVTGSHWPAVVLAVLLAITPCLLILRGRIDAQARMIVSITAVAIPALLLYVSAGQAWQTDLHMLFFAILAATSILCDWKALAAATAVVAIHHLGFGLWAASWVFEGESSLARIFVHAVILLVEAGTLMWVAQRIVALVAANEQALRDRETAAAELASDRALHAEAVATVTTALGNGLTALALGDLTETISIDFAGDYARLKRDFNATIAGLRSMITSVTKSTEVIRGGSVEIAVATEDLARRTETNAASLEETSAALVQIEGRVRGVASAAADTVCRADQATSTVNLGRTRAEAAKQAMDRVSISAKGIDNVIEGLDKIAFQTRVLAMNAAVEAGRAGDAGRGFAVVADLVSALAMRAEEEAKRARDQLTLTQAEIVAAGTAVDTVDGALADIAGDVGAVNALLAAMASDNEAQALAITEITAAVGSMDRATQQNAAMVEETSAAARALTAEVAVLADAAAGFKCGNDGDIEARDRPAGLRSVPRKSMNLALVA